MKGNTVAIACLAIMGLSLISLFVGASSISMTLIWSDPTMQTIFFISRLPRTLALLLAGSAMAIAGFIMQLLTQNRFVEPSLIGTTQSASLGLLLVLIIFPSASIMVKMGIASSFALLGTMLFMVLLRQVVHKSTLVVPLVGIMLSAIIGAITVFIAMYFDLLQSLGAWMSGDFSSVIKGRYELLWIVGLLVIAACWIADGFTVAGMGRDFAVNIGLNYPKIMLLGMSIVAIISGVVVVVVGVLPFVGLIVPNLLSHTMGDNSRRTLPWICLSGGGLVLLCDIIGRLIRYPFEIPASVILGVIGAVIFLFLLFRQPRHAKQ